MRERQNISSASSWEPIVGYSRAVRLGHHIAVAGTTSTDANDAYGQTKASLEKIETALRQAGATRSDVFRTRIFVKDIDAWADIGRAHLEFFGDIMPVATMVEVSRFVDPAILVEIEVDAIVAD